MDESVMSTDAVEDGAQEAQDLTWRRLWQVPTFAAATLLMVSGMVAAVVTRPSPDFGQYLDRGAEFVVAEQFEEALDYINKRVHPYLESENILSPENRRQFHMLRARAIYLGQLDKGIDWDENHRNIVDEYAESERWGDGLNSQDGFYLADTFVALGMYDRALERAALLPESGKEFRSRIIKRIVELKLDEPTLDHGGTAPLLSEFLANPDLTLSDRTWAVARQAEMRLKEGVYERAIISLLREIPLLLDKADGSELGELFMLLGRAYMESGAIEKANTQLTRADELLPPFDVLRGDANVLLAKIDEYHGELEAARDRYVYVLTELGATPAMLPARLGLAEVQAGLGNDEESLGNYQQLIRDMQLTRPHPDVTAENVKDSILARFYDRFDSGDPRTARRFGILAEDLYSDLPNPPAALLEAMGASNRAIADDLVNQMRADPDGPIDLSELDAATREQTRTHLLDAGKYFSRHASEMLLVDRVVYGESLWKAADSYDMAGDLRAAISAFEEYAEGFPNESGSAEARFRLAQAHQARGDYELAAELYIRLIDDAREQTTGMGTSRFAQKSFVPLAQTYLLDEVEANDLEAEKILLQVVNGSVGSTGNQDFHDALVELGEVYYRTKKYPQAIERLSEAISRFPDDKKVDTIRYNLADSYRLDAQAIARSLEEAMPDQDRRSLERARVERLGKSIGLFDNVRTSLEGIDAIRRKPLEHIYLRNAYFFLGDCAFDLEDYKAAVQHYDTARDRYPKDPASLVAMMQIVNAYLQQDDIRRARTAFERARRFFDTIPDTAWDDEYMPMKREDWERWLKSSMVLKGTLAEGG